MGFLRNPSERLFGLEPEFELEDARGKYDEIHSFSLGFFIAFFVKLLVAMYIERQMCGYLLHW